MLTTLEGAKYHSADRSKEATSSGSNPGLPIETGGFGLVLKVVEVDRLLKFGRLMSLPQLARSSTSSLTFATRFNRGSTKS